MGTSSTRKRILFVTATRADFGKLKSLVERVAGAPDLDHTLFVTGMHMLSRYGSTVNEIRKAGFDKLHTFINQDGSVNSQMDLVLANTIQGLGHYLREYPTDLIVVHGDRIETLAGAIVGALNNVLVGHLEGGELSGTVDELLRHAVTKLSQIHFVANEDCRARLIQMGEAPESVFVIGSPDIDVMLSGALPAIDDVRARYEIPFPDYAIFLYHPVTTELDRLPARIAAVVDALEASQRNFVVIYPNNDAGGDVILERLGRLAGNPRFRLIPSMRFEAFLSLLKHTRVIVGNSSAGIREAPVYGVPTVNIGSRQLNRYEYPSIVNVAEDSEELLRVLADPPRPTAPSLHFGHGRSADLFMERLRDPALWSTPRQKQFRDRRSRESGAASQAGQPSATPRDWAEPDLRGSWRRRANDVGGGASSPDAVRPASPG
jgi:UDP-N-acetylglucosamine 2-epimerase (hydrolysing)